MIAKRQTAQQEGLCPVTVVRDGYDREINDPAALILAFAVIKHTHRRLEIKYHSFECVRQMQKTQFPDDCTQNELRVCHRDIQDEQRTRQKHSSHHCQHASLVTLTAFAASSMNPVQVLRLMAVMRKPFTFFSFIQPKIESNQELF